MLKGILLDVAPEVAESQAVKELLAETERNGINYIPSSHVPFSRRPPFLTQPPENLLILTDSASGIASARETGILCIGYAPPESKEDLSGAYALFEDFSSIDVAYLCRTHAHAMGYPAEILSTERLTVREFSEDDFPELYRMCTEPSTASFMEDTLSDYDTEKEKHCAYLCNIYPLFDLALWGVYEKITGKLIGRAGFSLPENDDHTFSLGYLMDVPYRRQGYAKELLPALLTYAKEQGYPLISAKVKKENIASQRTLAGCGFPYDYKVITEQDCIIYTIFLTM